MNDSYHINIKGRLLDLSKPGIMGILNITPDSFYDGGRFLSEKQCLTQVEKMLNEGLDILDIGAMSSRPGAKIIDAEEETKRLIPIVKSIIKHFENLILSVDTFRGSVARRMIDEGVGIINDISAGEIDPTIVDVVAAAKVPYVIMHMKGLPENMQENPAYDDVVTDIFKYLGSKVKHFRSRGINDIIVDPGFGFGKTIEDNYRLLSNLDIFHELDCPVLVGVSRKSMIYKALHTKAEEALNGTSVLHTIALLNRANILRVHDVKEAVEVRKLVSLYNESTK